MTLVEALVWLASAAGTVGVGTVLAPWLERIEWFQALGSDTKRVVVISISIGVGLLAHVALTYVPVDVFEALGPYWTIIFNSIVAFLSSQIAYGKIERRK